MNLKPLGDKIIVEPTEEITKTAGGIYIPDNAKEKQSKGKVVSIGEKVETKELKAGDEVVYSKYAGTEFEIDSKKYLVVKEADILAKLV